MTVTTSSPAPVRPRGPLGIILVLAAVVVLGVLGYAGWRWFGPKPTDMTAAMAANTRGIGLMVKNFRYAEAAAEFDEAVRLAPDWVPAQINLGIALLNTDNPQNLDRAVSLFQQVLAKDPKNRHAHFCLGIIAEYRNQVPEAFAHFDEVTRLDPNDPHAWLYRGKMHPDDSTSPEAERCFEKALALDPNLNAARYMLSTCLRLRDDPRALALLEEHQALEKAKWRLEFDRKYTQMGHYADVIGRFPDQEPKDIGPLPLFTDPESFGVTLADGTRWANGEAFGSGAEGDLRRSVRERFGGTLVLLDYDRDGKPDLFLLGAVVQGGKVRDLLLHNDGGGKFRDVTADVGLAGPRASLGASAADFDNDGFTDLILTGIGKSFLFRNTGLGKFEDVSVKAGLDKLDGVFLGSSWVDLDQDCDLDLLIARYTSTADKALARLKGGEGDDGGLTVFLNVGEAPPVKPGEKPVGLNVAFRPAEGPEPLLVRGAVTGVALSDVDGDRDVDLIVLKDGSAPVVVINDRLMRFHQGASPQSEIGRWNGALVLDVNHDEQPDQLLVPSESAPVLWLGKERGATNSPSLTQAQALDLDLDGWTDVVGVSGRKAILLHNEAGKLAKRSDAFGAESSLPSDLLAAAGADLDGDGVPDMLLWSEKDGLRLKHNQGNGNRAVNLILTGIRGEADKAERTNSDGIGCWVVAQAGRLWTAAENTTLSAGLGQSRVPLLLGIGKADQADLVTIRWPDGVPQAEINMPAGELTRIVEHDRRITSCPVLMVWDGERFRFVTDFLGVGALGETNPDGSVRPPRPEESVKIEPGLLKPRDGHYMLKVAEPMDEVTYLDRLRLDVIDHPAGVAVFPDERLVISGPEPTQELLAFREPLFPVRARDHQGRDATAVIRDRDRVFLRDFAKRSWLGFAEDHFVELEFGNLANKVRPGERLFLVLAGWTDYAYTDSILAASQAGVELQAPTLERLEGGQWKAVGELGFPAGLPRVMTREVTDLLDRDNAVLRIRTNMQVYWDQIYLAVPGAEIKVSSLEVSGATLAHRGFMQQLLIDSRPPVVYDDARTEPVLVSPWKGRLTRTGDVTPLLTATDDRFVVCGPGDEVTVKFDAANLPALPAGWQRSFVLRTWGYCKDTSPLTQTGGNVEPLPFRGMKNYPYGPEQRHQAEAAHGDYPRLWNTRPAGGR